MTVQLTGTNRNGSPELSLSSGNSTTFAWSPFGGEAARTGNATSLPGFNGERQDPLSRVTHLGNGYRAYSPALRRFTCPDSESPLGEGGINPYVYCDHDPVNKTDPSGHMPIGKVPQRAQAVARNMERAQYESLPVSVARPPVRPASAVQAAAGISDDASARRAIPAVEVQGSGAAAAQTERTGESKPFTFYRVDGRSYETMQTQYPQGFTAWKPLDAAGARKVVNLFMGSTDTTGLPDALASDIKAEWGKNPKPSTLSNHIKYHKNKTETNWISTALNTDGGGQSGGSPIYEIKMNLYQSRIVNNKLVPAPEERRSPLDITFLTDTPDINNASIIAINHGPLWDPEVSFLTGIPLKYVKPYSG